MHPAARVLICAHGTASASGQAAIAGLIETATQLLAPTPVATAFVNAQEPTLGQGLRELSGPAIVVPLFLSSGFHVHHDVPLAVSEHRSTQPEAQIHVTPALGPDLEVAGAIAHSIRAQLAAAGRSPSRTRLILAWAGSSDPHALNDVRRCASWVSELLGTEVEVGSLSAGRPAIDELLSQEGDPRPVYLQSYLLAPGFFQDKLDEIAQNQNLGHEAEISPAKPPRVQVSLPLIGTDSIRQVLAQILARRAVQG